MKIGFIGTGTIASAMIHGISEDNFQIWVSERNKEISTKLAQKFSFISVGDNQTVVDNCEIIIVSLLANKARTVLPPLNFHPGQRVLSVMIDIDLQELAAIVSPAVAEAIFIPYTFIKYGHSPLLVYPESGTLQRLFGKRNKLMVLSSEDELKYLLVGQAVLSPIIQMLNETSSWLTNKIENRNLSENFLRSLIGGALLCDSPDYNYTLLDILHDLATEGGLNYQLNSHFDRHNIYRILAQGLDNLEKQLGRTVIPEGEQFMKNTGSN